MSSSTTGTSTTKTGAGEIRIIDKNGASQSVTIRHGSRLMPELKIKGVGIIGMCGGQAACGTCHVYVGEDWHEALPAPDDYEAGMLEELESSAPNSRLACQLVFREELHGLELAVAPHE